MEVETRMPLGPSPARPLSAGPSYSPITPERGTTPDPDLQEAGSSRAQTQRPGDEHHNNDAGAKGREAKTRVMLAGPILSVAEKLQLGEHVPEAQKINGLVNPAEISRNLALESLPATFATGNTFFQGDLALGQTSNSDLPDLDTGLPVLTDEMTFVDSATSIQDSEPSRIRAFAKLEFEDGQFYMNTYAIEIGRDRDAARQAERRRIQQEHDRRESEGKKSRDGSNPDLDRAQKIQDAGISAAASVVSGGIMHMGDGDERSRRKKKRSKSGGSSSRGLTRHDSMHFPPTTDYQALANASLVDSKSARPVDLTNMMPSPDECPLIPIHPPPTEGGLTGHKGISRKHVRIAYNPEKALFELHVLGKNGCFIEGAHMERGEVVALASGTYIQIGGVTMRFVLPNVPDGETGTDLRSDAVSHSAMSFDFEDGRGESNGAEQDSESPTTDNEDDRYRALRLAQQAEAAIMEDDEEEDEDDEDQEEHAEMDVRKSRPKIVLKLKSKVKPSVEEDVPAPLKRKVGRPPKNGIMSKREEAELRRKEKEAAKAKAKDAKKKKTAEDAESTQIKVEDEQTEDVPSSPIERRKARKRKPGDGQEPSNDVIESIEKEQSETPVEPVVAPAPPPKSAKKEKPAKPPRSPSPVFNEAELTPEQLAKPTQSYVILIHEALSNHPEGRMSLPQIYRAIERKYPYYKLRVQTVGWQSSVRHNLSQHPAFVKIERDGKGWMWGLDPAVSIEREKKRRPSPPPMQAPGWNAPGSAAFSRPFPQNVYAGNGQMPQNPYAMFPNGHPAPNGRGFQSPNALQRPPFPGSQQPSGTQATYQSPYGTNRPPVQAQTTPGSGQGSQVQQLTEQQQQQQQQQQNQSVPQMPAPYLNPVRSQSGTQNQSTEQGRSQPDPIHVTQTARPGSTQTVAPSTNRPGHSMPGAQAVPPAQTVPSPSPPLPNNPHGVHRHVWAAIERFREALKPAMSTIPDGEATVSQAIDKCIGLRPPADKPYRNFAKENSILAPLKGMLAKLHWPAEAMIAYAEGKAAMKPSLQLATPASISPAPAPVNRQATAPGPPPANPAASAGVVRPLKVPGSNPPPPLPPQYQAPPQHQQRSPQIPIPQQSQSQAAAPATVMEKTPDASLKRNRISDGADVEPADKGTGDRQDEQPPPTKKVAQ